MDGLGGVILVARDDLGTEVRTTKLAGSKGFVFVFFLTSIWVID